MSHNTFRAIFTIAIALSYITFAGGVHATTKPATTWQPEMSIDETAFKYIIRVPTINIKVPTVVEIPIHRNAKIKNNNVLVKSNAGVFENGYYRTMIKRNTIKPTPFSSDITNENSIYNLVDNNINTYISFPYTEGQTNTVSFMLSFERPVLASGINLALPRNVALPDAVRILSISQSGKEDVLVSKRKVNSTSILFPETEVRTIRIEFSLSQPLRISEVNVISKQETISMDSVRFLAQPNEEYIVYLDPDRKYGRVPYAGTNLQSNDGVLKLTPSYITANPVYSPADTDKDGIPDTLDNCPNTANKDQKDVDGNGQGDVCDDFDRDGIITIKDNCPKTPNYDQRDTDGDGVGDACDTKENRFTEANPWVPWVGIGVAGVVLIILMFSVIHMKPVGNEQEDVADTKENENDDTKNSENIVE